MKKSIVFVLLLCAKVTVSLGECTPLPLLQRPARQPRGVAIVMAREGLFSYQSYTLSRQAFGFQQSFGRVEITESSDDAGRVRYDWYGSKGNREAHGVRTLVRQKTGRLPDEEAVHWIGEYMTEIYNCHGKKMAQIYDSVKTDRGSKFPHHHRSLFLLGQESLLASALDEEIKPFTIGVPPWLKYPVRVLPP